MDLFKLRLDWELEDIGQNVLENIENDKGEVINRKETDKIDPYEVRNDPKFLHLLLDSIESDKETRTRRATLSRLGRAVRPIIRKQVKINDSDTIDLSRGEKDDGSDEVVSWSMFYEMPIAVDGMKILAEVAKADPPEGLKFRTLAFNDFLDSIVDQYEAMLDAEKKAKDGTLAEPEKADNVKSLTE